MCHTAQAAGSLSTMQTCTLTLPASLPHSRTRVPVEQGQQAGQQLDEDLEGQARQDGGDQRVQHLSFGMGSEAHEAGDRSHPPICRAHVYNQVANHNANAPARTPASR